MLQIPQDPQKFSPQKFRLYNMFSIFGPDYIIAAPVSLTLFNDTTLIDGVILCS